MVDGWHEHTYPYKLGNYQKTLLTTPVCIGTLDYSKSLAELQSTGINNEISCPIISDAEAECHFVAIWIDYQLTVDEESVLHMYSDTSNDFPIYSAQCIKYFPQAVKVNSINSLQAKLIFNYGDSDFTYDFAII